MQCWKEGPDNLRCTLPRGHEGFSHSATVQGTTYNWTQEPESGPVYGYISTPSNNRIPHYALAYRVTNHIFIPGTRRVACGTQKPVNPLGSAEVAVAKRIGRHKVCRRCQRALNG